MSGQTLITPALLAAVGARNPAQNAPWLAKAAGRWGIDTAGRVAMWLANVLNESGALACVSENLNYSSAARLRQVFPSHFGTLAQAAKCVNNSVALGNIVYGESLGGYDFRGRGWGQITGHANYAGYAVAIGKPLSQVGAWMETPEGAADSAAWYWHVCGCSLYADEGDLLSVRDEWAGLRPHTAGPFGLASVEAWYVRIVAVLGHPLASTVNAGTPIGKPIAQVSAAQSVADHEAPFGDSQSGLSIAGDPQGDAESDLLDQQYNPGVSV